MRAAENLYRAACDGSRAGLRNRACRIATVAHDLIAESAFRMVTELTDVQTAAVGAEEIRAVIIEHAQPLPQSPRAAKGRPCHSQQLNK